MAFGARLQALRKAYGLTQEELGERIDKKKQSIYYYERDKRQCDYDTLIALSRTFGVSVDYLIGNEPPRSNKHKSKEERSLFVDIPLYRTLSMYTSGLGPPDASIPTWAEDLRDAHYFYCYAIDDSMSGHRIFAGDLLRVREESHPQGGQVALVALYDELMLRTCQIIEGNAVLMPSNPNYGPVATTLSSIRVFGVVESVSFNLRMV